MKRDPLPPRVYPPGWFSEPVTRGAGFPPGFVSRLVPMTTSERASALPNAKSILAREQQATHGTGWGTGLVSMPKTTHQYQRTKLDGAPKATKPTTRTRTR